MPSIQDDLRQRLAVIVRDLDENGKHDPEAVWLIGSLAATITDKAGASSWPGFKNDISAATYDGLLIDFEKQGNALYASGEVKKAYAIQTLATSLICRTQRNDPHLREGEELLDAMITAAIGVYRKTEQVH